MTALGMLRAMILRTENLTSDDLAAIYALRCRALPRYIQPLRAVEYSTVSDAVGYLPEGAS